LGCPAITKYADSPAGINVPAAVAVGATPITILTGADEPILTIVQPKGASPLLVEVPLDEMFSLVIMREAI
jgi:hypothetical protein